MAARVRFFVINSIMTALYLSFACAVPSSQIEPLQQSDSNGWSFLPSSSSSFASKIYDDCERKNYELVDCLKVKVVSLLDRVSRSDSIELDESISLVRETSGEGDAAGSSPSTRADHGRALTENEVEDTVAGDADKGSKLNEMIFERISNFLSSHSLKIGFPKFDGPSLAKSLEEGRGKMKKTMGMFMMAAMMKAMMMIPLSIGTLFILAGKALIISKIALVLSLIITLKKLLSKPTEHVVHESHGWNSAGGAGGWDKRSYRPSDNAYAQNAAQNLAYSSYAVQ